MAKASGVLFYSVMMLALSALLLGFVPLTHALTCQVRIDGVDYPATVAVGAPVQVNIHLTLTCSASQVAIAARVDLVDVNFGKTLSSNSVNVGYVGGQGQTFNETVSTSATAPSTAGAWNLRVDVSVYVTEQVIASASKPFTIQVGQTTQQQTAASASGTSRASSMTTETAAPPGGGLTLPAVGAVVSVALIALVLAFVRRKKVPGVASPTQAQKVVLQTPPKPEPKPAAQTKAEALQNISTGYLELDAMLAGGLPVGYSILLVSPPCDERDLLFRRIIESGLSLGTSIYFMSRDLGRTKDLTERYKSKFHAFSPQADKIPGERPNLFRISGVENLNDLNISLNKAMEAFVKESPSKILILDLLSDVLLQHKALTTRRWLDDFITKRKADGFTVLGTLNPLLTSKTETQTIIDLFDGIIEIYERELRERARRFLIVKKMYGRKYQETELMLDKDKLF